MYKFFINYDEDELLYLANLIYEKISDLDRKRQMLRDFEDEIITYLSGGGED